MSLFKKTEGEPQASPVPAKTIAENMGAPPATPVKMSFYEALKMAADGHMVYKKDWGDKKFYGVMQGGILKLHKPDDKFYDWIISQEDMMGDDWIIINEK